MAELGSIVVVAAFIVATYVAVAAPLGDRWKAPELLASARNGVYAVAGLLTVAIIALLIAFLSHDFSLRYVADHSSRTMPGYLVAAAIYSGQQGSLLYWAWTLSLFSAVVVWQQFRRQRLLIPYVMAVLMGVEAFFTLLLAFVSNPFERNPVPPPDGVGLNPLLYDAGMLVHPPLLLAGYMSWTVPFAFAIAALVTGQLDAGWIRATRRYALVAWAVLGAGNLMGAWWAYHVLGWGGYWGWDPVENVAILPWFVGTAYLHSVMIQERRGMLKVWNLTLLLATFLLSIFGTFVVRSGVISSVHSFAQSAVGPYYLAFLALVMVGSLTLLFHRMPYLRSDNQLDSMLSREAAFLLQNLIFVALAFAIFWGTIFPLVTEAVQGVRITVGPPYFNQVAGPILLAMVFLMGVAPLMPWRKASRENLLRSFSPPLALATVGSAVLALAGIRHPYALLGLFVCMFVVGTIVLEFYRGARARHRSTGEGYMVALMRLIRRNNRRYGGYLVHLGIVAISVGAIASHFYQLEHQQSLRPGESFTIGSYTLTYHGLQEYQEPGMRVVEAVVDVAAGSQSLGSAYPQKRFHQNFERQPSSVIYIRTTPLEDLYLVLAGWESDGRASFLAFVNPMVAWVWLGGALLMLGGMVTMWPEPRARLVMAPRPLGEESRGEVFAR